MPLKLFAGVGKDAKGKKLPPVEVDLAGVGTDRKSTALPGKQVPPPKASRSSKGR